MPIPSKLKVLPNDSPQPVDFPAWTYDEANNPAITVDLVESDKLGPPTKPLLDSWKPVWKLQNPRRGTGGLGVKADLVFDRNAAVPPECIPFYDKLLWVRGATLNIYCSYPGGNQEMVQAVLVFTK